MLKAMDDLRFSTRLIFLDEHFEQRAANGYAYETCDCTVDGDEYVMEALFSTQDESYLRKFPVAGEHHLRARFATDFQQGDRIIEMVWFETFPVTTKALSKYIDEAVSKDIVITVPGRLWRGSNEIKYDVRFVLRLEKILNGWYVTSVKVSLPKCTGIAAYQSFVMEINQLRAENYVGVQL